MPSPPPRLRGWLLLLSLFTAPACFVSSAPEDDTVRVRLGLDLPVSSSTAKVTGSYWDGQGLFKIKEFPKYVRVGVGTRDFELASGSWPDPDRGIGAGGEGAAGEVQIEVSVRAGNGRVIRAMAYIHELGNVMIYKEKASRTVDLVAGQNLDLALEMVRHETGTLDFMIKCKEGQLARGTPTSIALVDDRAQVVFPARTLKPDYYTGTISAKIPGVPVGRPMWARIFVTGNTTGKSFYTPWNLASYKITSANDSEAVSLQIRCDP